MKPQEVDWFRVQKLILASFRGTAIAPEDQTYLQDAHKADKNKYAELGQLVRDAERRRVRMH